MDENLVGYLLGSLDQVTHARVKAYVEANPDAQDRLRLLAEALTPLAEDADDPEPPSHLYLATLARLAEHQCRLPRAPVPASSQVGPPSRRFLHRADWIVAAVLMLLVGGVAISYTARQWQEYQRVACSNNLRNTWVALAAYADMHEGEFPRVDPTGPRSVAGIFVPILAESGLAKDVQVNCPGKGACEPVRFSLFDLEQAYRDSPEDYRAMVRDLSGHYSYCLGYLDNGKLHGLRRDSSDGLPILADSGSHAGTNSSNHGGKGQNVLFVGGHVRWAAQPTVGQDCDHIYVNHHHRVNAGVCRIDSVLGSSQAQPHLGE